MKPTYGKYICYCLCIIIIAGSIAGCSKMNATYKDFIKDGAVIYPGRADSLAAHPGNGRIELSWLLSDPNVKKCMVYWNQGQDSVSVSIGKISGIDTIHTIINNLNEGTYTFNVYSFDNNGHVSVGAEILGKVYGKQYNSALVNRFIKNIAVIDSQVVVAWSDPDEGAIGEEITYTMKEGTERTVFTPVADSAKMNNYKPGKPFTYRTLYLPDSAAIDTFYTTRESVTVAPKLFELKLDKSKFKPVHLPTDTYQPHGASNTMDKIWDGILNTESPTFLTDPGTGFPQWFTFDLGVKAKISRIKYYQRGTSSNRLFNGGNIKEFEIWGSNDPNPDGSWDDSWALLLTCESKKPSGSPPGEMTQGDIDYALAGEEFIFPDTIPAARYIRIKTFENWDTKNRSYVNIGELTFWATEIE